MYYGKQIQLRGIKSAGGERKATILNRVALTGLTE